MRLATQHWRKCAAAAYLRREEFQRNSADPSTAQTKFLLRNMGAAIGFAAIIVVLGLFAPKVLSAMEAFLIAFFDKATLLLQKLELRPF